MVMVCLNLLEDQICLTTEWAIDEDEARREETIARKWKQSIVVINISLRRRSDTIAFGLTDGLRTLSTLRSLVVAYNGFHNC
jgi:hypothetical protein